jgi:hypothetical protein
LGRQVGLSPLETAKAFGAPLMTNATMANDAGDLLDEVGDGRLRYGEVTVLSEHSGTTVSRLEIENMSG